MVNANSIQMPKCKRQRQRQPHKMVKYTQTILRQQPANCLNVFDHFVGLVLKGSSELNFIPQKSSENLCSSDDFRGNGN